MLALVWSGGMDLRRTVITRWLTGRWDHKFAIKIQTQIVSLRLVDNPSVTLTFCVSGKRFQNHSALTILR